MRCRSERRSQEVDGSVEVGPAAPEIEGPNQGIHRRLRRVPHKLIVKIKPEIGADLSRIGHASMLLKTACGNYLFRSLETFRDFSAEVRIRSRTWAMNFIDALARMSRRLML